MSQLLALLAAKMTDPQTRENIIALMPKKTYDDGRTKQCHKDECDINKIMARFDQTGTISHLEKNEGVYADFSDFDFFEQTQKLTRGREIFDELPAELRREFGQSPAAFFAYVNDPANKDDLRKKLPGLAEPGTQLPHSEGQQADEDAAKIAANEPASEKTKTAETEGSPPPPAETKTA